MKAFWVRRCRIEESDGESVEERASGNAKLFQSMQQRAVNRCRFPPSLVRILDGLPGREYPFESVKEILLVHESRGNVSIKCEPSGEEFGESSGSQEVLRVCKEGRETPVLMIQGICRW